MRKKGMITVKSDVRKLFLTIYEENVPDLRAFWDAIKNFDKDVAQIFMIAHEGDYCENDFFDPKEEKKHFHVLIRFVNGNHRRVETILNSLFIVFRPEDKGRLEKGEALLIPSDFYAMLFYLTHESSSCEKKWHRYNVEDIISNLSLEEIKKVREGYVSPSLGKVSKKEMAEIDKKFFQWGYDLKNFSDLEDSLSFEIRDNSSYSTCEKSYYRGIERRISDNQKNHVIINRMNVFITGGSNKGKTWACEEFFKGDEYIEIDGGGTGKFDKLKCSHNTIILNDDVCPNLMNMSDNKICPAYKRMKNNPYWCGKNLIISSNLTFEEFIRDFADKQKEALRNRFFVINVAENKKCYVLNVSKKCVDDMEMKERFLAFLNSIQKSIMEYEPKDKEDFWKDVLNYNTLDDPDFKDFS